MSGMTSDTEERRRFHSEGNYRHHMVTISGDRHSPFYRRVVEAEQVIILSHRGRNSAWSSQLRSGSAGVYEQRI